MNGDLKFNNCKTSAQSASTAGSPDNMSETTDFVRHKLERFQASILHDVEKRTSSIMDDIMQEMRLQELRAHEFRNFAKEHQQQHSNTWNNRVAKEQHAKEHNENEQTTGVKLQNPLNDLNKGQAAQTHNKRQRRDLPDKVFVTRESYLTALLEVAHMKSIYHIFYIILLIFFMNSVLHDYFVDGRVNFGLGTFKIGLNKLHYWFGIWLLQHAFIIGLYFAFGAWAIIRAKLHAQPLLQRIWSHSCIVAHICTQFAFAYLAPACCFWLDLPFITSAVLLMESYRLLMKMHAFVRTNQQRVLAGKLKSDNDGSTKPALLPTFACYLYFLFAPTLIYRDNYPRTSKIRWNFAIARFLEVVAVAFLYSYIFERYIQVYFGNFGADSINASSLILKFFGMLMPSVTIFLCGFYLLLHSWLNFTSELLRFGDRMFYKDWWTASTYEHYYRNWNVVVHDWLYEYVYRDSYNILFNGNKTASSLMVFLISAVVHEFVMGFSLKLFFPVMFFLFGGLGVTMVFVTRKMPRNMGNIIIWFSLIYGNALMISLYSAEYYARFNCPKEIKTWYDYLTPAVWNCYKK